MTFRLPTATEKAEYVLRQFDRIAWRYDLANDVISLGMHRLWKSRAVDALKLKPDGHYLDVCCGSGDLAINIARRLNGRGQVVGIDFSKNMLKVAARRAEQAYERDGLKCRMEWVNGDAQELPFEDRCFDGAIISFGLRNLTDLERGIEEMARVVRAGGTIVNLDLGHPSIPIFTPVYHFYFKRLVPLIGQILVGDKDAYSYLPSSLETYPAPHGITAIFKRARLQNVVHEPLAFGSVALHKGIVI
jgi:demethylmenaquinone methyltransferase/2-methoxy-6-polyprenyl-1,4-benzoquinol methylase